MTKITKFSFCLIPCLGLGLFGLVAPRNPKVDGVHNPPRPLQVSQKAKPASQEHFADAIAELRSQTSPITRAMVIEEQQRIQAARERYKNFDDEQPRMEIVQDEYGMHWRRLSYSDGRIRYELPDPG